MRPNITVAVIAAALIVAAGVAAHGGLYQLVSTGPESAYLVNRWTGEVRVITGTTWRPVTAARLELEKDFRK
ncbi:MAG: hypothetical protein ACT4P5_02790 [Armatimonadota bacterium]